MAMKSQSNLRGAPLFLRPSVVRSLIEDVHLIARAVVPVPVLPVVLVDQPGQQEALRQAQGEREAEITALSGEHDAPENDNQVETSIDMSIDNDEPDRVAPVQAEGAAPVCRDDGENPAPADWPDAPFPEVAPELWPEHADPDLDRPEPIPADNARAYASKRITARRSDGFFRHAAQREERELEVPVDDRIAGRKANIREAAERLAAERATRIDWAKVAAVRARPGAAKSTSVPATPTPLQVAPSREECLRCGIPGWKGCAHFLPCEDQPRQVDLPERSDPAEAQKFTLKRRPTTFTGRRQGIGVLKI